MKLTFSAVLLSCVVGTFAFVPPKQLQSHRVVLAANRREFLDVAALISVGWLVPQAALAEPRPVYLTEPTDEFKASEAKATEFKRAQLTAKQEFLATVDRLLAEGNDAEMLEKHLKDLKGLVRKTGGLPLGIKKEELYKAIRSKKAKGFWPTNVEIA